MFLLSFVCCVTYLLMGMYVNRGEPFVNVAYRWVILRPKGNSSLRFVASAFCQVCIVGGDGRLHPPVEKWGGGANVSYTKDDRDRACK